MRNFQAGSVWRYRTRPGEENSLAKIQEIEADPETGEEIFPLTITGLKSRHGPEIGHVPVCRETLELSLTDPAEDLGQFPSCEEGLGIWRSENGGVYHIPIADIVSLGDVTSA